MMYQLEIQTDGQFVPVAQSSDPEKLWKRKEKERAIQCRSTGHRIFRADRKRLKSGELAGAPRAAARRVSPGVLDVKSQAKLAAEHLRSTDQKGVHVFPLGKGHSHTSNQFRKYLFGELTGRTGWLDESDRVKAEAAAERLGYIIIEVDPDDYRSTS
jgi:hypothetical protein